MGIAMIRTKNNSIKVFLIGLLLISASGLTGQNGYCEELTPKEILQRADEARGNLQGIKWEVKISSVENGREQNRAIDVKARGYDFFAILKAPPKVRGQILLMADHNMWFASPGLSKALPVSPRQRLVGGAAYGDIASTNYAEDYHATPLNDEMVDGELCYVFDLKAVTKNVTYDRIIYWVSKDRLVGIRSDFFTVSGKKFKVATMEYSHEVDMGDNRMPFVSRIVIKDIFLEDNVTTMSFSEPILEKIPDSTFDINLLIMRSI